MSNATSIDGDTLVIANINGKYLRFPSLKEVPHGSKVYSMSSDLEGQTRDQLEKLSAYLTGTEETFESHAAAVGAVWQSLASAPLFDAAIHLPASEAESEVVSKAGKKKTDGSVDPKTYVKKREPAKYVMKPITDKSLAAIEKLAPQAKACVQIIRDAAFQEIMEPELKKIFEESKDGKKLTTKQSAWRIFQYYRSDLIKADVLIIQ